MSTDEHRLRQALADRYAVETPIGVGGMATVFRARDLKHGRDVAIKVLRPEVAGVLGGERFLREIAVTANLDHPNILPLLDSGDADGMLFYVMPLVKGESLRDRLTRERQLPVDESLQIMAQVSAALTYAHSRGVIHRDIKPENIMLAEGQARVMDFGIARMLSTVDGQGITGTGIVVGSPAYMSPEQAAGERDVDGRSDVYASACVLYEMLAGVPPFSGPTFESLMRQHLVAPAPDVHQLRPSVPVEIVAAVRRALSKAPADRFATPALFATALTAARTSTQKPKHWLRPSLVGTALLAVAIAVGLYVRDLRTTDVVAKPRAAALPVADATPASAIPVAAILPFDVRGDSTKGFLGEALSALLTGRLDAPGVLRTLESNAVLSAIRTARASRADAPRTDAPQQVLALGATIIVRGTVVVLGDRLEIDAEMRGTGEPESRTVRAHMAGRTDSLFALADQIGASLLVAREGRDVGRSALGGTSSVSALKALLAGERALRAWQLPEAIAAYRQAIAIDSTYAFAWYRLSFAEGWSRGGAGRDALTRAFALSKQLPDRYAMLIAAVYAVDHRDYADAERMLATLVQRYPDDADAWAQLGEFRVHVGPSTGNPIVDAEAPLLRALTLDSAGHPEVRWHLAQIASQRGDLAGARALAAPLLASNRTDDRNVSVQRLSRALTGDASAGVSTMLRDLRQAPARDAANVLRFAVSDVGLLGTAYALVDSLASSASSRDHQREALAVMMELNAAGRRWSELQRAAAALTAIDSVFAAETWGWLAQVPYVQTDAASWRRAGNVLAARTTGDVGAGGWRRLLIATLLAARASDRAAFATRFGQLSALPKPSGEQTSALHVLRALNAEVAGDSALAWREMGLLQSPLEWQFARWQRARWLDHTGNRDEAQRWFLSCPWGPLTFLFTGPALAEAARIESARGNRAAADSLTRLAVRYGGSARE